MIYLYLKTHNITGLKYLGKTVTDPFMYRGSGKYWRRHLDVHGEDVTTEILFQSEDKNIFKEKAIYYSNLYNVIESKEFANIVPEMGDGGDTSMSPNWIAKKHLMKHIGNKNPMKNPEVARRNHASQIGQKRPKTSDSAKNTWQDPIIRQMRKPRLCCMNCSREVTKQNFERHYATCNL